MNRRLRFGNIKGVSRLTRRSVSSLFILVLWACIYTVEVWAQDDLDDGVPPPLKMISKDEKNRLAGDSEVKSRTKLALELMNYRLMAAEKELSTSDFDGMYRELGGFEALLDNQLDFLTRVDNGSSRVLDNFKRFEIGLRTFVPRVELIRRDLPLKFEPYVRSVGKYLREARARALDPLFSDTVVREPKRPN